MRRDNMVRVDLQSLAPQLRVRNRTWWVHQPSTCIVRRQARATNRAKAFHVPSSIPSRWTTAHRSYQSGPVVPFLPG